MITKFAPKREVTTKNGKKYVKRAKEEEEKEKKPKKEEPKKAVIKSSGAKSLKDLIG